MSSMPLVILAFAHERNESKPPTRNLLKEQLQITSLLSPMVQQNICEQLALVNITVERLESLVVKERHRIVGIHYASDVATLIRAREGKQKSMERALKGKLGRLIGGLPKIKWVFLNGDGSQEQAESLVKAGVPLVVRSHNLINDDAAFRLAYFFYQSVGQGQTLGEACHLAINEVRRDYVNKAKLTYNQELPSGYGSDWPFDYHQDPHVPSSLGWSLHHSNGREGEGLPANPDGFLPELPFKDFTPFYSDDVQLIGGREAIIRDLYDLIKSPYRPPVIILSGAQASGKTSLLCAQVLPRLKEYEVRYKTFEQDALSTFAKALDAIESSSLLKEWFDQEGSREKKSLKPQMITDLMNEVQASFRSYYRSEKADFTQFVRAVRAMWLREDASEGQNLLLRLGQLFDQQGQIGQTLNPSQRPDSQVSPLLVCLDQFDAVLEVKNKAYQRRQDSFWELLRLLSIDPDRQMKGAVILVVRDSSVVALTNILQEFQIKHTHVNIPPLKKEDIQTFIERFHHEFQLKEHYPLIVDDRFAYRVSQDLVDGPVSHIGYRLHGVLRELWHRSTRRPVLWTDEAYQKLKEQGVSLADLLRRRVHEFIELMRQQGDESFNEHLALDLLHQFSVYSIRPKEFLDWVQKSNTQQKSDEALGDFDDFETSIMRLSEIPFDENSVDVSLFLNLYLGWGNTLPSPWNQRQKSLADQSLWAFTQAIELGLLRGRLSAGQDLPSGRLALIHPLLAHVIEEQWVEHNGVSTRQVERFVDLISQNITPSADELERTRTAFLHTRLPNVIEAAQLVAGEKAIAENAEKFEVVSKQKTLLQWSILFILLLTSSRCLWLNYQQGDLLSQQERLNDQVMVYASQQAQKAGDYSAAAILLQQVQAYEKQSSWTEQTLQVLKHPLAMQRVEFNALWQEAWFTPKSVVLRVSTGQHILLSLKQNQDSMKLGKAQWVAHNQQGSHWASIDGSELRFWQPERSIPTVRRIQMGEIQSLLLNQAGNMASILYQQGHIHLLRNEEFPIKIIQGHRNQPIVDMKLNQSGTQLLVLDQGSSIQRFDLKDGTRLALLPAPEGMQLNSAMWLDNQDDIVAHYHAGSKHVINNYKASGNVLNLLTDNSAIKSIYKIPQNNHLLLTKKDRSLALLSTQSKQLRTLNMKVETDQVHINPQGHNIVLYDQIKKDYVLVSLTQQHPPITLLHSDVPGQVHFDAQDPWVMIKHDQKISIWSTHDGRQVQSHDSLNLISNGNYLYNQKLYMALGDRTHNTSYLQAFNIQENPLKQNLFWQNDEPKGARWSPNHDYILTSNHQGGFAVWNTKDASLQVSVSGHQSSINDALFWDKDKIITASQDQSLAFWNRADGLSLKRETVHDAPVLSLAMSDDGQRILSTDAKGYVWIWNEQGEEVGHWRPHNSAIRKVYISPQHKLVVTSSVQGESAVWNLGDRASPELMQRLNVGIVKLKFKVGKLNQSMVKQAYTLNDILMLAVTRAGQVLSWQAQDDARILLEVNTNRGVADISSDGNAVILSDGNTNIYYYDMTKNKVTYTLYHPLAQITQVRLLPNQAILAGSEEGKLFLWNDVRSTAVYLGQHEGAVTDLITQAQNQDFISLSATQAFIWRGPFNTSSLKQKLQKQTHICLSVPQRIRWLNEGSKEAQTHVQRCQERYAK